MVQLSFNALGFSFQQGVEILRSSFGSSVEALRYNVERAKDEAFGYQQSVEEGRDWEGERDDDGIVIWDKAQILEYDVELAEEAAMALRKAFVLALYHHWERSARIWSESHGWDHDKLVAATIVKGYPIDPLLAAVRDLANTLKHDKDRWGLALMQSWPDVFPAEFKPRSKARTDWYDAVRLADRHLDQAFEAVAGSGPTAEMVGFS